MTMKFAIHPWAKLKWHKHTCFLSSGRPSPVARSQLGRQSFHSQHSASREHLSLGAPRHEHLGTHRSPTTMSLGAIANAQDCPKRLQARPDLQDPTLKVRNTTSLTGTHGTRLPSLTCLLHLLSRTSELPGCISSDLNLNFSPLWSLGESSLSSRYLPCFAHPPRGSGSATATDSQKDQEDQQ